MLKNRLICAPEKASLERGARRIAMPDKYWLIKSEPDAYSWDDLEKDGETLWDGIRNHRAANNLRTMAKGDLAFFYHSVTGKEIVGIAEVSEAGLSDPKDEAWAAVKVTCRFWFCVCSTLSSTWRSSW